VESTPATVSQRTTDEEERSERNKLRTEHDASDIDSGLPCDRPVFHGEHTNRARVDAEPDSGTFALLVLIRSCATSATTSATASHDGDRHDGDAVDLCGFAENALHRHHILDRIEP
jgi:hypothetical protein